MKDFHTKILPGPVGILVAVEVCSDALVDEDAVVVVLEEEVLVLIKNQI